MRILVLALLAWLTAAPAAAPPSPDRLLGVWDGTMTTVQAGNCTGAAGPQDVRLVVLRGGDGKVRAGLTMLPAAADNDDGMKVVLSEKKVRFELAGRSICGEVQNKYTVKYEGAWPTEADGKRTLHLEAMDSPCPFGGCHFRKVVDVEWKRMPAVYTLGSR